MKQHSAREYDSLCYHSTSHPNWKISFQMKPLIFTDQYISGLLSFFYNQEGFLLFYAEERWVMMLDQCSHLNIPLSTGWLEDGCVVCPWHQWKFDAKGHCTWPPPAKEERVPVYSIFEKQGIIWLADSNREEECWEAVRVAHHWAEVSPSLKEGSYCVGIQDSTLIWFGGTKEEVKRKIDALDVSNFSIVETK